MTDIQERITLPAAIASSLKGFPSTLVVALLVCGSAHAQVSGVVLDAATQAPLPGARVTIQATALSTLTDASGAFALPGASGAGLTVVAALKGYYNEPFSVSAPAAGVTLQMTAVQVGSDPNYQFVDPSGCGGCHTDQYTQWTGSPMALAGQNTWVYDVYDGSGSPGGLGGFVYTRDSVHATAHPESECASCHQPEPWIKQPFSGLDPIGALSTGALHGISCEVCHKVADIDETGPNFPGIYPGIVTFNLPAQPLLTHQVEYGVLGDTSFTAPGLMRPSYQPQLTAALCAACHQDKNDPDGNGNFEEPNGVISEPTYLEWLNSPYGDPNSPSYTTCVDCHMPAYGATAASVFAWPQRDPATIRSHRIEGTTPAYLENAVDLVMTCQETPGALQVNVSITNSMTGHHVPTGVTVRNMILLVEAWRVADGQKLVHTGTQTVHGLGGTGDPALGYYAGLPGKLYAKLIQDAAGNAPTFFTDATGIVFDNRIPALATDTTSYVFQIPAGGGAVAARARLVYRRAFRPFVDAKGWTTDGHGHALEDVQPPYFGHLMEEATWAGQGGPGPIVSFGAGCSGLVAGWSGAPAVGNADFKLTLTGAHPNAPALLVLGFSDSSWLGTPLPLDLGPLGAPGCSLLVSVDGLGISATDAAGALAHSLPLPFLPQLAGATFYVQWAAAEPLNAFGWASSDALAITLQP